MRDLNTFGSKVNRKASEFTTKSDFFSDSAVASRGYLIGAGMGTIQKLKYLVDKEALFDKYVSTKREVGCVRSWL